MHGRTIRRFHTIALVGFALLFAAPVGAQVAALDAPTLVVTRQGHGKIALQITAGPSGAPNGFTVYWMRQEDFDSYGDVWPTSPSTSRLGWASYTGVPTLNTDGGEFTTFLLGPNQTIEVEIGDNRDETGLATDDPYELIYSPNWGVPYAFTAFANGGAGIAASLFATAGAGTTTLVQNCTFTQGFWRNHPELWPVSSLTLGTVSYGQTQLLAILGAAVQGNGLVSLAHQLVAAKLNLAFGANPISVAAAIASADAMIGGLVVPPVGSGFLAPGSIAGVTQTLDDFNNGIIGPGHCDETRATGTTWGALKVRYR